MHLLSPRQSGFRDGHSCKTLLLKATGSWKKAIAQEKYVAAAFLDFREAFGSVSHKKLLTALNKVGVCGTALQSSPT
ncbi:hypothetical protein RvY_05648 [Ramazzottius varieornatus]|uniref:Uncharacterized protein n=1 Tax=Ramazzottius varieornatus TaxID=947166 RepID=A0A1D1V2E7_RAMVA|nr:hypothetical protein RvY_05648 [Ramazzottius varieornatus]